MGNVFCPLQTLEKKAVQTKAQLDKATANAEEWRTKYERDLKARDASIARLRNAHATGNTVYMASAMNDCKSAEAKLAVSLDNFSLWDRLRVQASQNLALCDARISSLRTSGTARAIAGESMRFGGESSNVAKDSLFDAVEAAEESMRKLNVQMPRTTEEEQILRQKVEEMLQQAEPAASETGARDNDRLLQGASSVASAELELGNVSSGLSEEAQQAEALAVLSLLAHS